MAQLAPLLGQLRLAQTLMMFPLSKISVLVHAECWYRPVSTTGLPTAREAWRVSRRDSGFSIVKRWGKSPVGDWPPTSLFALEEASITSRTGAGVKARFWCRLSRLQAAHAFWSVVRWFRIFCEGRFKLGRSRSRRSQENSLRESRFALVGMALDYPVHHLLE